MFHGESKGGIAPRLATAMRIANRGRAQKMPTTCVSLVGRTVCGFRT